ncbi:MAG: PD40 domain-containing protein [Blastocatellia bacterium]|nr:PD40 domain-containing protein [Blastocatellia bacterium]
MKMHTAPGPETVADRSKVPVLLRRRFALLFGCLFLFGVAGLFSNSRQSFSAEVAATATGRPELVLQTGHVMRVDGIAFSPDGKLLASGSADNTIKLWDTTSKREVRTLIGHTGGVRAVAFRADGQWLASGDIDGNIKFWDVATGQELRNLAGNGSVSTVCFSPDGRWFAAGNMEKGIKLWDLNTEREAITLSGHGGLITIIAFSRDGHWLASGSADKTIKIWDVEKGREARTLKGHTDKIATVAFSSDGQWLATGGLDGKVKLWRVGEWREQQFQISLASRVLALTFSPDGHTLISADVNKTIKLNDVETGRELRTISAIHNNDDVLEAIAGVFSSDGRWMASSTGDKTVELRDVATGLDVHSLTTHSYGVSATVFSSGGRWFATGGKENTVKLWEVATGRELHTLDPRGGFVNAVAFSPDERMLASGSLSGLIALWDVTTGQRIRNLQGHSGSVNAVTFSPDGRWLVSGGNDGSVRIWNVADGHEARPATNHAAEVTAVVFSPDGKWIVSGSADKTIKIWEATTGGALRTLSGHKGDVLAVAFSPDGQWIASGGTDNVIRVWRAATGHEERVLSGHAGEVKAVAFSKDGGSLVSGSKDNTIKVWDVATGQLAHTLVGHSSEIYALAFSADGRWFISGSEDGSTRLWDAKTGDAMATILSLRESAGGFSFQQTDWLVVSPDGLFDGSPAAWNQILWRFDQSSFNVRPVEVFFNDFFYPGLLADILAGKKPRAPQDISQVDRRQPVVTLTLAEEKVSAAETITMRNLAVKIQVAEAPPDKDHAAGSGARDVRLFRNGSLVKIWHGDVLQSKGSTAILETTVPIIAGANQLTVYGFNRDNIKSPDATVTLTGAGSLKRPATAYIFAVGLNTYANAGYNLKYAVPDAKDFSDEVQRNAQNLLGRFARVETISLTDQQATKANILAALYRLAGTETPLPADAPPDLSKLKAAEPEDAVVIYFAGHGLAYQDRFYMLPHDLGYEGSRRRLTEAGFASIVSHSISDRELEDAFEKVNAGQILFVIDACNSGQALEAEEKRRGPMNSKGLAQLAYEKGIYILAAAQSYQAALEADEFGHGLLTYALIEEGLKKTAADRTPKDGRVLLREWIDYATERVPQLQEEKMLQGRGSGKEVAFVEGDEARELLKRSLQRPRAFYRRDIPVPLIAINHQTSRSN